MANHPRRLLFATLSFKPSAALNRRIWDIFEEEVEHVGDTEGFSPSVVVSAVHINGIKNMKVRGGNAINVESDGPLNGKHVFLTEADSGHTNVIKLFY